MPGAKVDVTVEAPAAETVTRETVDGKTKN